MANLETLELTINGSSKSASEGIDQLIHSLSSLSKAVGRSVSGLKLLNGELSKLKKSGVIKLPNLGKVKGVDSLKKATKEVKDAKEELYDVENNNGRGSYNPPKLSAAKEAEYQQKLAEAIQSNKEKIAYRRYMNNFYRERERLKSQGLFKESNDQETNIKDMKQSTAEVTQATNEYKDSIDKTKDSVGELENKTEEMKEATVNGASQMKKSIDSVKSSASGLLSKISRIAQTMLIRKAINAIINAAKEGLENFYNYSKQIGNTYYSSMNKLSSKWNQFKNQLGAALGTALNAFLPVLTSIATAATYALNAVTALFALLSGESTYTKAIENTDDYTSSAKSATSANKELLASFDELNVIQNETSSGSSGSGTDYSNLFEEVELPSWMEEWKPIIEAIVYGTLGSIILPKIWDWIKKIISLFGTGDGKSLLDTVTKLFKKDTSLPDITEDITKMGLYAAAAEAAAVAIGTLKDKVTELKGVLEGLSVVSTLLNTIIALIGSLVGGTIKLKVDRKEFDELKKDFEKFKKENSTLLVVVAFDHTRSSDFWRDKNSIDSWCDKGGTKTISVVIDHTRSSDYSKSKKDIDNWLKTEGIKTISIVIDQTRSSDFSKDKKTIDTWINTTGIKKIVFINDHTKSSDFSKDKDTIDKWLAAEGVKTISVVFDHTRSSDFWKDKKQIDNWVEATARKVININFDNVEYIAVTAQMAVITAWLALPASKVISVSFDAVKLAAYTVTAAAITTWVNTKEVKVLDVMIEDTLDIKTVNEWIENKDTKVIDVKINTTAQTQGSNGNLFNKNIFTVSVEEALDYFKKNDLKTIANDFWESLKQTFGFTSGSNNNTNTLGMNMSLNVQPNKQSVTNTIDYIQGFKPNMQVRTYNTREDTQATVDAISTWTPWMQVRTYNSSSDVNATVAAIETWHPALAVYCYNTRANMEELMSAIESWHPTIVANVTTGDTKKLAEGGLVESGELFIANENGKAEMIGRFGTHTAVANQEQMVEAMARGVQYAQAEQNGLLREQNSILRSILQKDSSVRLSASSALGRIAKQSIGMYETVTGV